MEEHLVLLTDQIISPLSLVEEGRQRVDHFEFLCKGYPIFFHHLDSLNVWARNELPQGFNNYSSISEVISHQLVYLCVHSDLLLNWGDKEHDRVPDCEEQAFWVILLRFPCCPFKRERKLIKSILIFLEDVRPYFLYQIL